jgi:uncharacterized protein YtpQ (UPF0354 family)
LLTAELVEGDMLRFILALFLVINQTTITFAEQPLMNEEQFVAEFVLTAKRIDPTAEIEVTGELEVHIRLSDGNEITCYLNNAFRMYKQSPESLSAYLEEQVRKYLVSAASLDGIETTILPVIRPYSLYETYAAGARSDYETHDAGLRLELAKLRFAEDLGIFFVRSSKDLLQYVTVDELGSLGMTAEELFRHTLKTLEARPESFQMMDAGAILLIAGDDFAASLILTDGFWKKINRSFDGIAVTFLVDRNTLILVGSNDRNGLEAAADLARKLVAESPYPISSDPIAKFEGDWRPFVR